MSRKAVATKKPVPKKRTPRPTQTPESIARNFVADKFEECSEYDFWVSDDALGPVIEATYQSVATVHSKDLLSDEREEALFESLRKQLPIQAQKDLNSLAESWSLRRYYSGIAAFTLGVEVGKRFGGEK